MKLPRSLNFILSSSKSWKRDQFTRQFSSDRDENQSKRKLELMKRGLPKVKPIENVKEIILVASGKGGVGKSSTSVNLAAAIKSIEPDSDVGLLDTDVFGPTVPLMMNLSGAPMINQRGLMEPLVNYDIKCMSMGFLIDDSSPVVWRGLMVMSAIQKLLYQVHWSHLDYLIVDSPPGTGDTLLSLLQSIPISGVLLVTTSQKASMNVAMRGLNMFRKMDIPVIGIVENMSTVECQNCGKDVEIFAEKGDNIQQLFGVDLLERFPLDKQAMESIDSGKPIVISNPQSKQSQLYKNLASKVIHHLKNKEINT